MICIVPLHSGGQGTKWEMRIDSICEGDFPDSRQIASWSAQHIAKHVPHVAPCTTSSQKPPSTKSSKDNKLHEAQHHTSCPSGNQAAPNETNQAIEQSPYALLYCPALVDRARAEGGIQKLSPRRGQAKNSCYRLMVGVLQGRCDEWEACSASYTYRVTHDAPP